MYIYMIYDVYVYMIYILYIYGIYILYIYIWFIHYIYDIYTVYIWFIYYIYDIYIYIHTVYIYILIYLWCIYIYIWYIICMYIYDIYTSSELYVILIYWCLRYTLLACSLQPHWHHQKTIISSWRGFPTSLYCPLLVGGGYAKSTEIRCLIILPPHEKGPCLFMSECIRPASGSGIRKRHDRSRTEHRRCHYPFYQVYQLVIATKTTRSSEMGNLISIHPFISIQISNRKISIHPGYLISKWRFPVGVLRDHLNGIFHSTASKIPPWWWTPSKYPNFFRKTVGGWSPRLPNKMSANASCMCCWKAPTRNISKRPGRDDAVSAPASGAKVHVNYRGSLWCCSNELRVGKATATVVYYSEIYLQLVFLWLI